MRVLRAPIPPEYLIVAHDARLNRPLDFASADLLIPYLVFKRREHHHPTEGVDDTNDLADSHFRADGPETGDAVLLLLLGIFALDPNVLLRVLNEALIAASRDPFAGDADDSSQLDLAIELRVLNRD